MNVSVVGTGYVGLVSGACFSEAGHHVTCVDNDASKVQDINAGRSPIYEKGLDELLERNIGRRLNATTALHEAVLNSDLTFIAVGTPFDGESIDLQYIRQAAQEIGRSLKEKTDYHVVVVKSTVVPGTTDDVVLPLLEEHSGKKAGVDFGVGMNPEFLREGEAVQDFMNPDRIVLGGVDTRTCDVLSEVYAPFADAEKIVTNNRTAEMIKYTANALLATLISFSNEIGNLCSVLGGIDALEVMKGVHLDRRLAPVMEDGTRVFPGMIIYLEAGCGFGGSCFPKDVKALIAHGNKAGRDMDLLKAVIDVNRSQPRQVLIRLAKHYPDLAGKRIAVLGLAFKPGTDDMRESPSIPIIEELIGSGARVSAYDPVAVNEAQKLFPSDRISYCRTVEEAVQDADAVLVLTRWPEFEKLPEILHQQNRTPLVVDGRRMLPRESVDRYEGIGV